MRRTWRLTAFLIFLSLALLTGGAQPRSAADSDLAASLNGGLEKIAGEYYLGDGLAANLTLVIKPTGRFTYHAAGCLRTYADTSAQALLRNGLLVLVSGKAESPDSGRFLPVRWGGRLYLLEPERIIGFANAVNAGHEPRSKAQGVFYLRSGDWSKPVSGAPRLPAMYRNYLLAKPIEAGILRVSDEEETVELDAGRRRGLLPGMKLRARGFDDEKRETCKLTIVEAGEETATAKQNWVCDDLQAGDRAHTRWLDLEPPYGCWEDDFDS